MKHLFLEDLKEMNEEEVRTHIVSDYEVERSVVDGYDILIAYESVGSWGCDSASFILLKHKTTGELFEVNGSHCSCYGFEGQFNPEKTTVDYLKSDKFHFYNGGYDSDEEGNRQKILDYIKSEL